MHRLTSAFHPDQQCHADPRWFIGLFRDTMLPQMTPCGHFSSSANPSFRPPKRIIVTTIAQKLESDATMSEAERNLFITLSARAIGSLGFGLSILAIWFRWLIPAVAGPPLTLLPRTARISTRHGSLLSEPVTPTSPHTMSHSVINLDSPLTPSHQARRNRLRRVCFADSPHMDHVTPPRPEMASQETASFIQSTEPLELPQAQLNSNPSTPGSVNKLLSPPTTPTLVPTLTLDNGLDHGLELFPQTNRSSSFIPKMKYAFNSKSRRASLQYSHSEEAPEPPAKPKKKSTRPFAPPWLGGRMKPTAGSDTEINALNPKSSRTSPPRLPFHSRGPRPSSSGSGSNCVNSTHISLGSSLLARKPPRRSNTTPIPRTSPYEAPYFASPPIPFEGNQLGARSARSSLEYACLTASSKDKEGSDSSRDQ